MKLLVFGANSQLGRDLVRLLKLNACDFESLTTDEVDVLDAKEVVKAVTRVNPTQLINVATYANLQKAESDPDAARLCEQINTEGVTSLAKVCAKLGIPLIHLSSSYVFDGEKKGPYQEDDETNPVCRYGISKWYGERTLRELHDKHIILRTDWLFSGHNNNYFPRVIESCKKNNGKVSIVDNRFSPTHTADAARVILAINRQIDCNAEVWGTYHYNAMQPVNQDQFVQYVLDEAAKLDKALAKILPSLEIELLPVELPYIRNTSLNCDKIMATFGIKQRSRGEGLIAALEEIYGVVKPAPVKAKPKAKSKKNKSAGTKANTARKKQSAPAKNPKRSKPPAKKAAKQK